MSQLETDAKSIIDMLDYKANLKFRFSALLYKTVNGEIDYGTGETIRMLDAHILKDIDENPGILSIDLSRIWCRARSAICIITQRLEKEGYVTKETTASNKKERGLFTTAKGHELCERHRHHDAQRTSALISEMLKECSPAEIDAYFKVLEYQIKAMQAGYHVDENGTTIYSYESDKEL